MILFPVCAGGKLLLNKANRFSGMWISPTGWFFGRKIEVKSGFITHLGTQLFYCRYDHFDLNTLCQEITQVEGILRRQPEDSLRMLVNVTGTIISPGTFNVLTKTTLDMKKYLHRTAVLGVEGAVRVQMMDMLVKATGLAVRPFKTEEEAKTWLASK
jgi:hypothetical protein